MAFLCSFCVLVGCKQSSDPSHPVTKEPTEQTQPTPLERRGSESSGGGGTLLKYTQQEKTDLFVKAFEQINSPDLKTFKRVIYQPYHHLLVQFRSSRPGAVYDALETRDYEALIRYGKNLTRDEIDFVVNLTEFLEVNFHFNSMYDLLEFHNFVNFPGWMKIENKLKTLNSNNNGTPYTSDCKNRYADFKDDHRAWYSRDKHEICFNLDTMELDNSNFYSQTISLLVHEVYHMHMTEKKLDHEVEESKARNIQRNVFNFYTLKTPGNWAYFFYSDFRNITTSLLAVSNDVCSDVTKFHFVRGLVHGLATIYLKRPINLKQMLNKEEKGKLKIILEFVFTYREFFMDENIYRYYQMKKIERDGLPDFLTSEEMLGICLKENISGKLRKDVLAIMEILDD